MGIDRAIDITGEQRKTVLALLERHLPNTAAWVYGSRAKWTSRPQSDLDLVVFATPEQSRRVSDLRDAFEESNLPFRVDLFFWDDVPEQFRKRIEADHVVLVEREERGVSRSAWRTVPLVEAPVEIIDGDRGKNYPKQREFLESGHCLFLNAGNVTIDGFNFSSCAFISPDRDQRLRKGKLARHDVVLTTRGTIGNSAYYDESVPYEQIRINSGMVILRALKPSLNPRYFYLVIRSGLFLAQVQALRTGSAQPQLPIRDIKKINIPLPPLPEQRAIAHVLGTLDDKIELNRCMNETLEEMARALFKSWFVDFLPVRAKMAAKQNNPSLLLPQAESGTWFVYAIECADGSLYIGQTENLRQRWLQHSSSKGGRWTKSHPPQRVAYWEKQPSRQAAVEREKWLKTGFGRKWLKKEIAARTQTGDPVRAKMEGCDTGLPPDVADLFPDRLVDSDLGPIPEGWAVKALGELVELNPRESMKRGTIAPYLDMAGLPTSGPNPEDAVLREFTSGTRFRNGDTLFARITPCLENGKTAFVQSLPEDAVGWGSTEFIVMRAVPPVPPEYTYLLARAPAFRAHAIQSMTGTSGRQRARTEALAPYPLPFPPSDVWDGFSSLAKLVFAKIESNRKESLALADKRDALLPKLVSGIISTHDLSQCRSYLI